MAIITIGGDPGSGKSTVSKILARDLGYKHLHAGAILRAWCKEPHLNPQHLPFQTWYATLDPALDNRVDEELRHAAFNSDGIILEGRMAFHWPAPRAVKLSVYITCSASEAARRVFEQKQDGTTRSEESVYKSIDDAKADLWNRQKTEQERYQTLYGVNIMQLMNYDFVPDNSWRTAQETAASIKRGLDQKILSEYHGNKK